MQIENPQMEQLINLVVTNTIKVLEEKKLLGKANEKTAFQKTESLLFAYNGFKRIIQEKQQEIEEIRKYGVPQSCAVKEYVDKGSAVSQLVLDEERVEAAVRSVQHSVHETVQVIALIDRNMAAISKDPWYSILPMRYFEGRTLEDIGVELECTQQNVSYHKNRLVRELAMRLFPDQVTNEMLS